MTIDLKYLIPRIGGKRLLRKVIAPLIPAGINSYIEPFGGAGWMLFYKDSWAPSEVYNDLEGELVNLFRCGKYHAEELAKEFDWELKSRAMFQQWLEFKPQTDIQRAARFAYLIMFSYGAQGKHYATNPGRTQGSVIDNFTEKLSSIHKRLQKVNIEHKDYEELIKIYDRADSFFYCDPPYTGRGMYPELSKMDHERLARVLKSIKGWFLLSYNNDPKIRELYKDFDIQEIKRQNNMKKDAVKPDYSEILIKNY